MKNILFFLLFFTSPLLAEVPTYRAKENKWVAELKRLEEEKSHQAQNWLQKAASHIEEAKQLYGAPKVQKLLEAVHSTHQAIIRFEELLTEAYQRGDTRFKASIEGYKNQIRKLQEPHWNTIRFLEQEIVKEEGVLRAVEIFQEAIKKGEAITLKIQQAKGEDLNLLLELYQEGAKVFLEASHDLRFALQLMAPTPYEQDKNELKKRVEEFELSASQCQESAQQIEQELNKRKEVKTQKKEPRTYSWKGRNF